MDDSGEGEGWGFVDAPTAEAAAMDEDSAVARTAELTFDVEPVVVDARLLEVPVVEPVKIVSVGTIVVLSPRGSKP